MQHIKNKPFQLNEGCSLCLSTNMGVLDGVELMMVGIEGLKRMKEGAIKYMGELYSHLLTMRLDMASFKTLGHTH